MSIAGNRLAAVPSPVRPRQSPVSRVRLSQLRKLSECEQVAAVCYRVRGAGIEFLLIRTRGSGRWTFPKGSAEPGLTHAQAAALEAFEEAGVHGRIEEAAFAQYRRKRGAEGNYSRRSARKEFAVNAHLCEVLRLSDPKESNRNRTWFSAADAKLRLREGREHDDGREFARVVDRAVARIDLIRRGTGFGDRRQDYRTQYDCTPDAIPKDALQKVQIDFVEAYSGAALFVPYTRSRLNDTRQTAVPATNIHRREMLQGEVLQFGSPRELNRGPGGRKTKALGSGARNT